MRVAISGSWYYTNGGLYEWTPQGNDPSGQPILYGDGPSVEAGGIGGGITPYGVKPVGSMKMDTRGCRLNGDNLENATLATSGVVLFQCPGLIAGQPVAPRYFARTVQDENNWSHNSVQFHYAGFWHRPGARIRKIRIRANVNGGAENATISGGLQWKLPAMAFAA